MQKYCRKVGQGEQRWEQAPAADPPQRLGAPAAPGGQQGTARTPAWTATPPVAATSLQSKDTRSALVTSFCILAYGIVFCTTCGICEKHCICMSRAVPLSR